MVIFQKLSKGKFDINSRVVIVIIYALFPSLFQTQSPRLTYSRRLDTNNPIMGRMAGK